MSEYISLEQYNTYRIKSFAKHVYFPSNENEILDIVDKHKNLFFLGNGSNVIFLKEYYDDEISFMIFCKNFNSFSIDDCFVDVQAGTLLKDLALATYETCLSGIETFYDIPASLGGALIMNAGAYGDEIYTYIKSVRVLDLNTKDIIEYKKENIEYGYRDSMFKNDRNVCILSAKFEFEKKSKLYIKFKLDNIYSRRLLSLPQKPTAGSVFKKPQSKIPVGFMIEKLGLKGITFGDAQISLKHGGIIVNNGNASGNDIIQLITFIKSMILENYNIKIHEEQICI